MRKRSLLYAAIFSVLLFAMPLFGCDKSNNNGNGDAIEGQTFTVESPDKSIKAETVLDKSGSLYYRVFKENVPIVAYSEMGFTLAEDLLSAELTFEKKEEKEISLS